MSNDLLILSIVFVFGGIIETLLTNQGNEIYGFISMIFGILLLCIWSDQN